MQLVLGGTIIVLFLFNKALFVEKSFSCKRASMVAKQISLKVCTATNNKFTLTSGITLFQFRKIKFNSCWLKASKNLRVFYNLLSLAYIWQILKVMEFKWNHSFVCVNQWKFRLLIMCHIFKRIVSWLAYYITVLVANVFSLNLNHTIFVNSSTCNHIRDLITLREIKVKAWIIAWHRVQEVRRVFVQFFILLVVCATFIKWRVYDI